MSNTICKTRSSNIELLRLVSMFMILILHANYKALGKPILDDILSSPISSYIRIFVEQICVIAVNVFVLISGWFGIKTKAAGVLNILFQAMFFSALALLIAFLYPPLSYSLNAKTIFQEVYFGGSYWFVYSYIGLYLVAPFINKFITSTNRNNIRNFLIVYFLFQMIYGWVYDFVDFSGGYSMLSFIWLYTLARYLRLYPESYNSISSSKLATLWLGLTIIISGVVFFSIWHHNPITGFFYDRHNCYNSPHTIISAVIMLILFTRIEIKSRLINWLAASSFAIYLIHCNPIILPAYTGYIKFIYDKQGTLVFTISVLLSILLIGLACILVDKIRIAIWSAISKPFPSLNKELY